MENDEKTDIRCAHDDNWYSILLGIGVGVAMSMAFNDWGVGIGVGVALGMAFSRPWCR